MQFKLRIKFPKTDYLLRYVDKQYKGIAENSKYKDTCIVMNLKLLPSNRKGIPLMNEYSRLFIQSISLLIQYSYIL